VIVPTRDRPTLLREALASIRALEGPDLCLEIVIGDNGGLPETAEIARAFGARHLHVERRGAGAARNAGLKVATGQYVAFLDDDDLWRPGHLRPQLALLAARPELNAAVGQVMLTDAARQPIGEPWPASLPTSGDVFAAFLGQYPQIGATVARIGVRETVGYFDEALVGDEDWDWHLRLALCHGVGFVPAVGVLYRGRPAGTADDLEWRRLGFTSRGFLRNVLRGGMRCPSVGRLARVHLRHRGGYYSYFVEGARRHLAAGDRQAVRKALGRAIVSSPIHAAADLFRDSVLRTVVHGLLRRQPRCQLRGKGGDG